MPSAINLSTQPTPLRGIPAPTPFGTRLRNARQARGLSQQALAQAVGLSKAMISAFEQGTVWPRDVWMTRLAQALDIDETMLRI